MPPPIEVPRLLNESTRKIITDLHEAPAGPQQPDAVKQRNELRSQATKAMVDVRQNAGSRLKTLQSSLHSVDSFRSFQAEVQETTGLLQRLPADDRNHTEIQETLKTLENTNRDLEETIKTLSRPVQNQNQNQDTQQIVQTLGQRWASARTFQQKMDVLSNFIAANGGNAVVRTFLGAAVTVFHGIPGLKGIGDWIEIRQLPYQIQKVMSDALPADWRDRVRNGPDTETDRRFASEVKREYEDKKTADQNNFKRNFPTLDSYVTDRMRKIHNNTLIPNMTTRKNVYTIQDLIDTQGATVEQRNANRDAANNQVTANKIKTDAERREYNEQLNREYVVVMARALKNAGYTGITDEEIANMEAAVKSGSQSATNMASAVVAKLRGKASSHNSGASWRLYLYEGRWYEYDTRRSGLLGMGYLPVYMYTTDDPIPGLEGWETQFMTNPRQGIQTMISAIGSDAYIKGTASGFNHESLASLSRLKSALQPLINDGTNQSLELRFARRNDPQPSAPAPAPVNQQQGQPNQNAAPPTGPNPPAPNQTPAPAPGSTPPPPSGN